MGEIPKAHDRLFRFLIQRPELAEMLLRERLPPALASRLTREPPASPDGTSSNADLRAMRIDRLLRARLADTELPLYCVLEHRSSREPELLLRLLEHLTRVWTWVANERGTGTPLLPPVALLVVYHGSERWNVPLSFRRQIAFSKAHPGALNFGYRLIDLGRIADGALSANPDLRAGWMALKYATRPKQQSGALVEMMKAIKAATAIQATLMLYVTDTWKAVEPDAFKRVGLQVGLEESMTTIADEWRSEGRRDGMARMLARLLCERFGPLPESIEHQLASASEMELEKWSLRLLQVADLESVFAPVPAG